MLSNATRRRQYDAELAELRRPPPQNEPACSASHAEDVYSHYTPKDPEFLIRCRGCGGSHKAHLTTRSSTSARFCAECNTWHDVDDGDGWTERAHWWSTTEASAFSIFRHHSMSLAGQSF